MRKPQVVLSLFTGAVILIVGSLFPGPLGWWMRGLALLSLLIMVGTMRPWRKVKPDQ